MRSWLSAALKLYFNSYFILTSLWCLLSFIPYTYLFLIKAPPYHWMASFVRYQPFLFGLAFVGSLFVYWPTRKNLLPRIAMALQAVIGVYFVARNIPASLHSSWHAYACGLVILLPLLLATAGEAIRHPPAEERSSQASLLSYSNAIIIALLLAMLSAGGSLIQGYIETRVLATPRFEITGYVIATYIWLALAIVSVAHLVMIPAIKLTARPRAVRFVTMSAFIFFGLYVSSIRFLRNTFSFSGPLAYVYVTFFSAALTLYGFTILHPLFDESFKGLKRSKIGLTRRSASAVMAIFLGIAALGAPAVLAERDWNGLFQDIFTLTLWIMLSICIYLMRGRSKNYSITGILGVLVISSAIYWGLKSTTFLWARRVGATDGAVMRAVEDYAARNVSFSFAELLVEGDHGAACGDLCLTLRQYTNIPHAEAKTEVRLVDQLVAAPEKPPNIFIIVIDSLRPDYLGAYNPEVHFTPNIDSFARQSIVMRHAYTQYAGTTLSEPAIWSGALLLHSHYMQPFAKVNSLERLLRTDRYRMVVSYDSVLRETVADTEDLVKLDANTPWNEFEFSNTVQQLKSVLEGRSDERPVFFYTQPMNVHQFGRNTLPRRTNENWTTQPGFHDRIAFAVHQLDGFFGVFLSYLKSRDLYENSIIVVAADHGEATGEFGRRSHSTIIFPEVMKVPLIVHLPAAMRKKLMYDPDCIATLTDIAPTLYYLLGHRPINRHLLFGRPLFTDTREELQSYPKNDIFLASDERAAYGLLSGDGRFLFTTYDSPSNSFLFDLTQDPNALQNILTDFAKKHYEERIIEYLQTISHFYQYQPAGQARSANQ